MTNCDFVEKLNICTLSDKNYIYKGLALYQSLCETMGNWFILYYLCLDNDCYEMLIKLGKHNIKPILLTDLEKQDKVLLKAKSNPASKYGSQQDNYYWTLTPYFVNYLLKNKIEHNQKLIYADSDIFFYESPFKILEIIEDHSVGIHTHGFVEDYYDALCGWFNVGVMVFTKNKTGIAISEMWKNLAIDTSNPYYESHGTCGDQKYLEVLLDKFGEQNIRIFDVYSECGHLAAWNYVHAIHNSDGTFTRRGATQRVYFFHFSHFKFNPEDNSWSDSINGEWHPCADLKIKPYYERYAQYLIKSKSMLND